MKNLDEIKKILSTHRGPLERKYGIAIVGIFGSQARAEARNNSIGDILENMADAEEYIQGMSLDNLQRIRKH